MSFTDDMRAMSADEVRQAVISRLRDHAGIPPDENRGEPSWGLLASAFPYWRDDAAKLVLLDSALSELVQTAFEQAQWPLAKDVCDFVVALANRPEGWLADSARDWPFPHWLDAPLDPPDKCEASIAAYQLMRLTNNADHKWISDAFHLACETLGPAPDGQRIRWFEACWKAVLSLSAGHPKRGLNIPLFQAFAAVQKVVDRSVQARLLEATVAWSWLLFKPEERDSLTEAVLKCIGDFPQKQKEFLDASLRIAAQELAGTDEVLKFIARMKASAHARKPQQPKHEVDKNPAEELSGVIYWLRQPPPKTQPLSDHAAHRKSELCLSCA